MSSPRDLDSAAQERAEIDEAFAALANDGEAQAEAVALAEESVQSGWEALIAAEADESSASTR
jgi:hypothetical protein